MRVFFILRSFVASLVFALLTLIVSASAIFFSFFTTSDRILRLHIKWWGMSVCWLFGVRVMVHGKDRWKRETGGVVLFNHTSFFDIFAMSGYLPDMRFGAKIQLFKIPIFGAAMRRVGILPIDRERKEKVFAIYQKAVERLTAGEKIALAPEGKRTSSPYELLPFKSGPFIFALQSRVDLIPVVIKGAYEVLPKGEILPNTHRMFSTVHLYVLDPIPTDAVVQEKRPELQQRVRSIMQNVLDEKQNDLF